MFKVTKESLFETKNKRIAGFVSWKYPFIEFVCAIKLLLEKLKSAWLYVMEDADTSNYILFIYHYALLAAQLTVKIYYTLCYKVLL